MSQNTLEFLSRKDVAFVSFAGSAYPRVPQASLCRYANGRLIAIGDKPVYSVFFAAKFDCGQLVGSSPVMVGNPHLSRKTHLPNLSGGNIVETAALQFAGPIFDLYEEDNTVFFSD